MPCLHAFSLAYRFPVFATSQGYLHYFHVIPDGSRITDAKLS